MEQRFIHDMMSIGILSYKEQETLWETGQRCAKTLGVVGAGTGAVIGAGPGSLAGALAGLVIGTVSCTVLNRSMKDKLKELASSGDDPK